ncbi:glycoside hydrolase family 31 protein [Jatrophihabitans sp. YIM 134969]
MADDTLDRIRFRGEPVADPAAVVTAGPARFTVLTSRLIRLEWTGGQPFEDRASYAFPVRRGPVPEFTAATDGATTTVDTGDLLLRYTDDGRPFHAGNLSVELRGDVATTWHPGVVDHANLGGARRTVDDCRGDAVLEPGLVSRSGWALHDDSDLAVFDSTGWPTERETGVLDWYFFGYGHAYGDAVADYTRFGGRPAMIPRFVLGAWWSRYHAYTEPELRALVEEFAARDFPLDVVVIDMDWHLPDGWTGYTWNRDLFPDPPEFLAWLHSRGLKTTLNLHPAQGVQSFETAYPEFAERMDINPETGDPVPFDITDREFVRNYLELLHHPLEDDGVDFWWMDWQQGRTTGVRGMDPLTWLNHLHFEDMHRRAGRRPVDFSRWGGLGSHRYPVGFSGDSFALWGALAFQPRYTAAGANVAYGWWSHDIGGHSGPDDPELYVRWVQFGAVSPVLRLHSNNQEESDRRPWAFGEEVEDLTREAFRLRYELLPYLYTAARTSVDTGASLVRPTAWIDPEHDGSYLARSQYLLGPDLLVAPVVRPMDTTTGLADADVWLPEGVWIERGTGESFTGPRWVRLGVPLDRIPQFVRPGTILPLARVTPTTQTPEHLTLEVFLGAGAHDGTARVYDDDGESTDAETGRWTDLTLAMPDPSRAVLTVAPGIERSYTIRLPFVVEPAAVVLDDAPAAGWTWEDTVLTVPVPRTADAFTVDVSCRSDLSLVGSDHDSQVRAAELAVVTGSDSDPVAAVLDLPLDSPARALGVARLGGPAVQVLEYTTPDEAVVTLGRVVVAAPEHGPLAEVDARWTLERDGRVETVEVPRTDVAGTELVLDAPFPWDGTLHPARWSVEVTVRWGEFEVARRHVSAVLDPALPSWWVRVDNAAGEVTGWTSWAIDPTDIDFGSLAQRVNVRFRVWDNAPLDVSTVGTALTTITLTDDREVAFAYVAGGEVAIAVDGDPVPDADVTGNPPIKYFTLDPPVRRSAPVTLRRGTHTVTFRCSPPANLADVDWYLSTWVTDPNGTPLLDVVADAGPRPS